MGNSSSKTNETRNILPEVSGEYEKQLGLPKVLLQEIGSRVELSSIKNFSLSCKQVYFALKEDSFWRMFALKWFPELEEVEGDNWKEKVENSFAKWQKNWCNKKFTFERVRGAEVATLKGSSGLSSVFSEFSFVVGEESLKSSTATLLCVEWVFVSKLKVLTIGCMVDRMLAEQRIL